MSTTTKSDIWMPLYVADYARDTFHLTRDQHGGYLLLLMACWSGGGRIPNTPSALAAITKSTPQEWAKLKRVLLPFFRVDGAWLTHKRVTEELRRAAHLSATRRANGARGGRPKKQTESKDEPSEKLPVPKSKAKQKLNETHARVTVVVSTSEDNPSPQSPSEGKDSTGVSEQGSSATVVPLASRGVGR